MSEAKRFVFRTSKAGSSKEKKSENVAALARMRRGDARMRARERGGGVVVMEARFELRSVIH